MPVNEPMEINADDDFFGLQVASTKVLPKISYQSDVNNGQSDADIFEPNFFPGLQKTIEHQNSVSKMQIPSKSKGVDFFEQHFIREEELNAEECFNDDKDNKTAINKLLEQILPVWKFKTNELVDLMAKRVIHETDDFIAFDKPYQMAYSSGPNDQAQLDRVLKMLSRRVVPNGNGLYLIKSLDKACSGVILFAKNKKKQQEYKQYLEQGDFYFRFRCLCKNSPKQEKARISFPLIKVLNGRNIKLCPLIGRANKDEQLYHLNTDCVVINKNNTAYVSLLDAFTRHGMTHQVRSHLYYGLDCPIVGDEKYVRTRLPGENIIPTNISQAAQSALGIRKNDIRKLPMFMHLAAVHVPKGNGSYSVVKAEMPQFFIYALKKLSLLKK